MNILLKICFYFCRSFTLLILLLLENLLTFGFDALECGLCALKIKKALQQAKWP